MFSHLDGTGNRKCLKNLDFHHAPRGHYDKHGNFVMGYFGKELRGWKMVSHKQ